MTKWEYKYILYTNNMGPYEQFLNKYGSMGWELVTVNNSSSNTTSQLVFKRKLNDNVE